MKHRPASFALLLALAGGTVEARAAEAPPPSPAEADAAAALLSRFPAGRLPAEEPVLDALHTLEAQGVASHATILESIVRDEDGAVGEAARSALASTRRRCREASQRRFAGGVPDEDSLESWVAHHRDHLVRADGSRPGPAECRAIAYSAIVLGPPRDPAPIPVLPPADASDLLGAARAREDRGDPSGALLLYAQAAASGSGDALEGIRAFGVDPERLLLGLTASVHSPTLTRLDPVALDGLVKVGTDETLSVLLERSRTAPPLDRAMALDAIGEMLQIPDISPPVRAAALVAIDEATRDPRPAIREAARTTLAEARTQDGGR